MQKIQCVNLDDYGEVHSGAYVCSCPSGATISAQERRANDEFRDKQTEFLLTAANTNSSKSMDHSALEQLDERLSDRDYVANLLIHRQVSKDSGDNRTGNNNEVDSSPASNHANDGPMMELQKLRRLHDKRPKHFVLGSQLETDAALTWLAEMTPANSESNYKRPEDLWPRQSCRFCSSNSAINSTSGLESTPTSTCEDADLLSRDSFKELSQIFVVSLHIICILLCLILMCIIIRVRKSKVSFSISTFIFDSKS